MGLSKKDCGRIWMERLIKRLASLQWTERKERGEEKELTEGREERKKKGIGKTEWTRAGEDTAHFNSHHVSDLWQL